MDLMDMADIKEGVRKKLEEHCKELEDKNDKLTKLASGQETLQGARNLIWDMIIVEPSKVQPYLDFIRDKESAIKVAKKHIYMTKLELSKRLLDTAQRAISFMNSLNEEDIK